jgi:hypothetical protein
MMNKEEAKSVLNNELDRFRTMSHEDLVRTVGDGVCTTEQMGISGEKYLIQIKTKWKKRKKSIVRISANIRSADKSPQESRTWHIPILNIAICYASMSELFTTFTRGPDD